MGLDTTHGCWHGAYSAFNRWRTKLCGVAGYGALLDMEGFGGDKPWPSSDPLVLLLYHSDCDGDLPWDQCGDIADRLESLLPGLRLAGDGGGHVGNYEEKTKIFIAGLRKAHASKENVEFG